MENKVRFILSVVKGEIIVSNRKRADLFVSLQIRRVQISDYEMFCIIGHFSSSICFNAFLYILLTQFSGVIAPFPVYIGILFVNAIITNKVLMFYFWQAYEIILNVYFLCIVGF